MSLKTTLVGPTTEWLAHALDCARKFRNGAWGREPRRQHRDAVIIAYPGRICRVHVWGDPAGHVRAYVYGGD